LIRSLRLLIIGAGKIMGNTDRAEELTRRVVVVVVVVSHGLVAEHLEEEAAKGPKTNAQNVTMLHQSS
jgi:hypothetical protein